MDIDQIITIAVAAGRQILDVYHADFAVEHKTDGSPLTLADQRAHRLISRRLAELQPSIPVLSEESTPLPAFPLRRQWPQLWLVDPLDGTREFVKRNGEFTVNIALIEGHTPVLGVVHAPVTGVTYAGQAGAGAFSIEADGQRRPITTRRFNPAAAVMVASRSHAGAEIDRFHARLQQQADTVEIMRIGSSLKLCLVAAGEADIYPRLGPTSEWDTAAAHAVLLAAGGRLCDLAGAELHYNKPDILNPHFLAIGDQGVGWLDLL